MFCTSGLVTPYTSSCNNHLFPVAAQLSSLISPSCLMSFAFISGCKAEIWVPSSAAAYSPKLLHPPPDYPPLLGPWSQCGAMWATVQRDKPNWKPGSALVSVQSHTGHSLSHPSLPTHPHHPSTGSKMLFLFWPFPVGIPHLPLWIVMLPWRWVTQMLIHPPLKLRGSSGLAQKMNKASKRFSFSPFPRRRELKKNTDSEKK